MEVTLNLKVCDAKLYQDTEIGGKMDPFVILTIDGQTKVKDRAGKNPKWPSQLKPHLTQP